MRGIKRTGSFHWYTTEFSEHYISECKDILGDEFEVEWQIGHTEVLRDLFKARRLTRCSSIQ